MPHENPKSLMRSLGEFVGHLWHGARRPIAPRPPRQVVRHDVQERTDRLPEGTITLRRTTIEEVELRPPKAP